MIFPAFFQPATLLSHFSRFRILKFLVVNCFVAARNMSSVLPFRRVRLYKAAVSLNGTGVSLLERHQYRAAMLVFKDSLDLMRAACDDSGEDVSSSQIECKKSWLMKYEQAISHYLRKASNFLIQSSQNGKEVANVDKLAINNIVTVLTDDQSPASTFALTQTMFNSSNVHAIRINENKSMDEVYSLEIEVSLILYNFATAYLCHVETMGLGEPLCFMGLFVSFICL